MEDQLDVAVYESTTVDVCHALIDTESRCHIDPNHPHQSPSSPSCSDSAASVSSRNKGHQVELFNDRSDELISDCIEERFRVDRRKLERLLQVVEDDGEDNAEEFFAKIMKETNTVIAWPSKLKIGAKSKKDPHIKVSGTKQAVTEAKERVLSMLNTKSSRVTVKFEISFTEHSHVIGKGGCNIKRVMNDTGCHIHFPDSNRNNQTDKSNQVSVAGPCSGVEEARQRIRSLQPLVFMFELSAMPAGGVNDPTHNAFMVKTQQTYDVSVMLKPRNRIHPLASFSPCTVVVRGSVFNMKAVKEATVVLFEYFAGRNGMPVVVTLALDIAPQHHPLVVGQSGANIRQVMQRSGAMVHLPNPDTKQGQQRGTIYISGSMDSVCLARHMLLGCIPLVLMFDIDAETPITQEHLSAMMEELGVFISIRPKPKQPTKSVIVKCMERNIVNMYEARRRLTDLDMEPTVYDRQCSTPPTDAGGGSTSPNACTVSHSSARLDTVASAPQYQATVQSPKLPTNATVVNRGVVVPNWNSLSPYVRHCAPNSPAFTPLYQAVPGMLPVPVMRPTLAVPCVPPSAIRGPSMISLPSPVVSYVLDNSVSSPAAAAATETMSSSSVSCSLAEQRPDATAGLQSKIAAPLLLTDDDNRSPGELASMLVSFLSPDAVKSLLNTDQSRPTIELLADVLNAMSSKSNKSSSPVDTPASAMTAGSSQCHSPAVASGAVSPALGVRSEPVRWGSSSSLAARGDLNLTPADDSLLSQADHWRPNSVDRLNPDALLTTSEQLPRGPLRSHFQNLNTAGQDSDGLACSLEQLTSSGLSDQSKAPGSNRPKKFINSSLYADDTSSDLVDHDYQEMKLKATRAIRTKPFGEDRIPNDSWSGYGFSMSLPDADMRLKLSSHAMRGYRRPTLYSSYEGRESDGETEVWKEAGKSSCDDVSSVDSVTDEHSLLNGGRLEADLPTTPSVSNVAGQAQSSLFNLDHFGKSVLDQARGFSGSPDHRHFDLASNDPQFSLLCGALGTRPVGESVWPVVDPALGVGATAAAAAAAAVASSGRLYGNGQNETWSDEAEDLAELFSQLGLGKYIDLFQQQEIDLSTFMTLTESDLKELGVTTFGARRKMLNAIADIGKKQLTLNATGGGGGGGHKSIFASTSSRRRGNVASQSGRW